MNVAKGCLVRKFSNTRELVVTLQNFIKVLNHGGLLTRYEMLGVK